MHKSAHDKTPYQVIDLDPYGSASQFIDAAVQSVQTGGLLCITCTDMRVLAGGETEACFAKYGGISIYFLIEGVNLAKTPYCHEMGLRHVLHAVNASALRYKRSITPLASCSIDFYCRIFVRVDYSPKQAQLGASKTSMNYHCHACCSFYTQPLGLVIEKGKSIKYKTNKLPVPTSDCAECGTPLTVAGPFYGGAIHDKEFVGKMVKHVKENPKKYGTQDRMIGMLSVLGEELDDAPFYYSLGFMGSVLHSTTPKLKLFMYVYVSILL
jgi:tRNA (guanine26-N2/guanine27-N2)-dimethyltransferase